MGAIRPELSLDFKPTFVPKTISDLLKEVSMIGNVSDKVSKLDGFVKGLEEEMRKIDAFKRELPLCMLLLNDAISALKDESRQCVARNVQPVLEEFIPLKNNRNDHSDKDDGEAISIKKETDSTSTNKDKKTWMSSVQLWNTDESHRSTDRKLERNDEARILGCKSRGEVKAFMPFKAYSGFASRNEERVDLQNQGLSLLTCGIKNPKEDSNSTGSRNSCSRVSSAPNAQSSFRSGSQPIQQQTARKQRRCWSPELHRRFVNALQHLGGSQVATPKQIRELMQVDGLTNDEVKSHLQKYRLHTRRVPPATSSPANQSLVVLGSSLWMSQEQFGDSLKASNSHSGSPQGPLQLVTNTGGTSTTGGDSMEDEEDAKSENYSWKSHVNRPGKEDV